MSEYICDRDQCGYEGPRIRGTGELWTKVWKSASWLMIAGPCLGIVFGLVLAIPLYFVHEGLAALGFLMGVLIAVGAILVRTTRDKCPACNRGTLIEQNSVRGQALLLRNRIKYDN